MRRENWSGAEFSSIDFGDERLHHRLKKVCQDLYEKPMSSINEASGAWQDTKAAYRLFDNGKVESAKLLEAHRQCIRQRIQSYPSILAIQDTTFFNYHNHKHKSGLGIIHSNQRPLQGLLAHHTLITTMEGLPLGLWDQKVYARKTHPTKPRWYEREPEARESYRWIDSLKELRAHLPAGVSCLVLADREADIFDFLWTCLDLDLGFVVRSIHNRVVGKKQKRWGPKKNANRYLVDYLEKQPVQGHLVLEVEDKKTRKKRLAHLSLRFCRVDFPEPFRKGAYSCLEARRQVPVFVVEVKEGRPPKGTSPVHWRLLTSREVLNVDQAQAVIGLYQKRWTIEVYHKVLKSGCQVEACRLLTFDRIQRALTLYSIIAWRIFYMNKIARSQPEAPCTIVLSREEWQPLYRVIHKTKKIPKKPPTVRQAIRWIAQMGGFLARKSDREPGITTIWRGWQALNSYLTFATYG